MARQVLLDCSSQTDETGINGTDDATSQKARDTICCPLCRQNHHVCIDQDQHCQSGLKDWMFDYYVCKNCDKSFTQAGLPIVLPGSVLIGAAILLIAQLIRYQF